MSVWQGSSPQSFMEVVDLYGIVLLKTPADLVVKNGGIGQTKTGDLMLGDPIYSGMVRFVQRWRFNEPTLRNLFERVCSEAYRRKQLYGARNADIAGGGVEFSAGRDVSPEITERHHQTNDEFAASEFGVGVYAGACLLVLSDLLIALRNDIAAEEAAWNACHPQIKGYSFGRVIEAAGNNFRHYDEWAKKLPPSPRQRKSIDVLAAVLDAPVAPTGEHQFARNVCFEVLQELSDGRFEVLAAHVFAFAKDLSGSP